MKLTSSNPNVQFAEKDVIDLDLVLGAKSSILLGYGWGAPGTNLLDGNSIYANMHHSILTAVGHTDNTTVVLKSLRTTTWVEDLHLTHCHRASLTSIP